MCVCCASFCYWDLKTEEERDLSATAECGICYEPVQGQFGLLNNCPHAFCLSCMREWRSKGREHMHKETVRQCPICRTESFVVIPSARLVVDPVRKAKLVEMYKTTLSTIKCRYFEYGQTSCPFGTVRLLLVREFLGVDTCVDADSTTTCFRMFTELLLRACHAGWEPCGSAEAAIRGRRVGNQDRHRAQNPRFPRHSPMNTRTSRTMVVLVEGTMHKILKATAATIAD